MRDDKGRVLNDETVEILARQATVLAVAGADIVAPSDMMDGRIAAVRDALEAAGLNNTKILSYAAQICFGVLRAFPRRRRFHRQLGR